MCRSLAAKGIHGTGTQYPKVGPVITAGGLIFTGTRDQQSAGVRRGFREAAVGVSGGYGAGGNPGSV